MCRTVGGICGGGATSVHIRNLILASAAALLAPAATASAAPAPILPLSDVQPGMVCTADTVLSGTTISSFTVTVIDVVDQPGEGARILVRASGSAVASTGIAEGFSGSPVYCPAPGGGVANAGAISEGVGDYGNFLALVTPIQQMLGEPVLPPHGTKRLHLPAHELTTPLTISGLAPSLFGVVQQAESRAGRTVLEAPAGGGPTFPVQPLVPGASVAVSYSTGTVSVGAVGTVTYNDAGTVYAFGHPFDGAGRRSLLLQDAYVYGVVPDPIPALPSFKLAVPGHTEGTLTSDTPNGVIGEVGAGPALIPIDVTANDRDTGASIEEDSEAADESGVGYPLGSSLIDLVAPLAIGQAAIDVYNGAPANETGTMCLRVTIRESASPLQFCNRYVGTGAPGSSQTGPPPELATLATTDVTSALGLLDQVQFAQLHVLSVSAVINAWRGLREGTIVAVHAPRRVRAGQTVIVRVVVRLYRAGLVTFPIRLRIPRGAHGRFEITISGPSSPGGSLGSLSSALSSILLGGSGLPPSAPTSIKALRSQFAAIGSYDGLSANLPGRHGEHVYRDPNLLILGTASARVRAVK